MEKIKHNQKIIIFVFEDNNITVSDHAINGNVRNAHIIFFLPSIYAIYIIATQFCRILGFGVINCRNHNSVFIILDIFEINTTY